MAEPGKYIFDLKEVAELLARRAGVTTGFWQVGARFGFAAINVGPTDEEARPSGVVSLLSLGLTKVDKPTGVTIDAATLSEVPEISKDPAKRAKAPETGKEKPRRVRVRPRADTKP